MASSLDGRVFHRSSSQKGAFADDADKRRVEGACEARIGVDMHMVSSDLPRIQ